MLGSIIVNKRCCCIVYPAVDCWDVEADFYLSAQARADLLATGNTQFIVGDELYHLGPAEPWTPGMTVIDDVDSIEPAEIVCACSSAGTPTQSPAYVTSQKKRITRLDFSFEGIDVYPFVPADGCISLSPSHHSMQIWKNDLGEGAFDATFARILSEEGEAGDPDEQICGLGGGIWDDGSGDSGGISAPVCHSWLSRKVFFEPGCTGAEGASICINALRLHLGGGDINGFDIALKHIGDGPNCGFPSGFVCSGGPNVTLSFGCHFTDDDLEDLLDPTVPEIVLPNELSIGDGSGSDIGENGQVRITITREDRW